MQIENEEVLYESDRLEGLYDEDHWVVQLESKKKKLRQE